MESNTILKSNKLSSTIIICLFLIFLINTFSCSEKDKSDMQRKEITRKINKEGDLAMINVEGKLNKLLSIRKEKGFPIDDSFNPGLTKVEIDVLTKELSFKLPEELYQLYQWRNGTKENSDFYFIFRDHRFLPLKEAIKQYNELVKYYGKLKDKVDYKMCFPFAFFEGSYLVYPVGGQSFTTELKHPILEIHEGTGIFSNSFLTFLDTIIAWFENAVHHKEGIELKPELEKEIWKQKNPSIERYWNKNL